MSHASVHNVVVGTGNVVAVGDNATVAQTTVHTGNVGVFAGGHGSVFNTRAGGNICVQGASAHVENCEADSINLVAVAPGWRDLDRNV